MFELKVGPQIVENIDNAGIFLKWATLILETAASAAWPISAVVIASLFRHSLRRLLERVVSVNGAGVAVDFGQQLEEAREASTSVQSDLNADDPAAQPNVDNQQPLNELKIDPLEAVLNAFRNVEDKLFEMTGLSDRRAVLTLHAFKIIRTDTVKLYDRLLSTRNAALHQVDRPISLYEAREFEDLAKVLVAALEAVKSTAAMHRPEISKAIKSMLAVSPKQRAMF